MRLPDEIKKCVVFFGIPSIENGVTVTKYKATGFFVGVPVSEDNPNDGFLYLVTAKHAAEKMAGKEFVLRANTKDGKSIIMKSPAGAPVNWQFHPTDGNADVVVFPWQSAANMDIQAVPVGEFLKSENLKPDGVGIGDEVCIIGLFKFHEGESRNHPMARIGSIAMIPDERVSTKKDGEMDAYLIEARSTGGMSGSPVFVASLRVSRSWLLLGLMYGHWELPESQVNDLDQDGEKQDTINSGIAIVTPAQKILDILYSEELSRARAAAIEKMLDGPVRDWPP